MKYVKLILFIICFSQASYAQIDEELGFVFVKAEYLMSTERYDDAIKELNKVIKDNPQYKNSLLLRAKAKYVLGAHRGVRNDVIKYIELNGVTADAARLLGLADYGLQNYDAALNSFNLALEVMPEDIDMLNARADINYEKGNNLSACKDWERAAKLGSGTASKEARANCGMRDDVVTEKPKGKGNSLPSKTRPKSDPEDDVKTIPNKSSKQSGEVDNSSSDDDDKEEEPMDDEAEEIEEEEDEDAIDFDAENDIYVDEDLTLMLMNGLGDRKVLEQPNILILSDDSGTVSVDVCVSGGGRVVNATYNANNSNLKTPSIISLAVRKSKEFWFENSPHEQVCGVIEFRVTGRE